MSAKIKQQDDTKMTELFVDGEFIAGWHQFEIPTEILRRIEVMLDEAVKVGEEKKAAEVRRVMGTR